MNETSNVKIAFDNRLRCAIARCFYDMFSPNISWGDAIENYAHVEQCIAQSYDMPYGRACNNKVCYRLNTCMCTDSGISSFLRNVKHAFMAADNVIEKLKKYPDDVLSLLTNGD